LNEKLRNTRNTTKYGSDCFRGIRVFRSSKKSEPVRSGGRSRPPSITQPDPPMEGVRPRAPPHASITRPDLLAVESACKRTQRPSGAQLASDARHSSPGSDSLAHDPESGCLEGEAVPSRVVRIDYAVNPPSIVRLAPVTKPASGPARYATIAATSAVVP